MAHTAKTKKILSLFESGHEAPAAANPAIKIPQSPERRHIFVKSAQGEQAVNIAYLLLNEQVLPIMEHFHCCVCDACVSAVMELSLPQLPQRIVRAANRAEEELVDKAADDMRPEAVRVITKAVISVKSNPRH